MENLILWRFSIIPTIFVVCIIGYLAYEGLTFPFNYTVIAVSALAIIAHIYFLQRKEKAARFKAFYAVVQDFGKPVSFRNFDARFERGETVFDAEFPRHKHDMTFNVRFSITKLYESFIIQHREVFTKSIPGCNPVVPSPLPENFIVSSSSAEFLLNLLKNRRILDEIYNYPNKFLGRFIISFETGNFEIEWTPDINSQIADFYRVCQTAVVFHDELKKLVAANQK
jgi:hypothetical protein